jgi:type II secretory pathway pseudopilin PulG
VVIAVIALLIGLLLPALRGAREAARAAACLSNQRSILSVLGMYAEDAKRYVPRESGSGHYVIPAAPLDSSPALAPSEKMDISWAFNLRPYLDERASTEDKTGGLDNDQFRLAPYYHDPARPPDEHNVHYVCNGFKFVSPGVLSIATKPPTPLDIVLLPAQTFYLTCFTDDIDHSRSRPWFNASSSNVYVAQFYDMWCETNLRGAAAGPIRDISHAQRTAPKRHGRGANVGSFDGHANAAKADVVLNFNNWDDRDYRR